MKIFVITLISVLLFCSSYSQVKCYLIEVKVGLQVTPYRYVESDISSASFYSLEECKKYVTKMEALADPKLGASNIYLKKCELIDCVYNTKEFEIDGLSSYESNENGTILDIDSDGDGIVDTKVTIDENGNTKYENLNTTNETPIIIDINFRDENMDGKFENIILDSNNSNQYIAIDSNGDGLVDKVNVYNEYGVLMENQPGININVTGEANVNSEINLIRELEWHLARANQQYKNGENGYRIWVTNNNQNQMTHSQISVHYINGILTTFDKSLQTGEDISYLANTNIEIIYNKSDSFLQDVFETFNPDLSTALHLSTAESIVKSLAAGNEVRVITHSQGATHFESSLQEIRLLLDAFDVPKSRTKNITLITLGGFSPKARDWTSSINVIAINNNDPIPALHGWLENNPKLKLSNHGVANYYPVLSILANPNNDLSLLYGQSFNAGEWGEIIEFFSN